MNIQDIYEKLKVYSLLEYDYDGYDSVPPNRAMLINAGYMLSKICNLDNVIPPEVDLDGRGQIYFRWRNVNGILVEISLDESSTYTNLIIVPNENYVEVIENIKLYEEFPKAIIDFLNIYFKKD